MKAVVCHETTLGVRDLPDPVPGPRQVLLDVVRCGICGSDLHARTHGDDVADAAAQIGLDDLIRRGDEVVLGHEFSGTVRAYGPRTDGRWDVGTPVVSVPMVRYDGVARMTGLSRNAPGGYAEQVIVDEAMTIPVPNGYDPRLAALTEPMAVAWHAVRKSRVGRRQTAVVIGCGPIGLAVVLMLKARGVRHVIASDYSAKRRELARECGADVVVDPGTASPWSGFAESSRYYTSAPQVLDLALKSLDAMRKVPLLPWAKLMRVAERAGQTPGGPVVFECVGVPGVIESIMASAPLYTQVVVVGVCMQPDTISPSMGINKEIGLQFVFAYDPGEFHDTLMMLADGTVDPSPLHTGTIGLDDVEQAFTDLGSAEEHAKVLIDPQA